MDVKTLFNAGDMVYYVDTNTKKAVYRKIDYIYITADETVHIRCAFKNEDSYSTDYVDEEHCFATKQALLNYITSDL
jgi:hypothetical protein